MKRILITGKGSYIGSNFKRYLERFQNEYAIDELDMMDDSWKSFDFSNYDVVYHVAGVAHLKERKENMEMYYEVNRDLAYAVAKKSKEEKIEHFIFMSSMSVYGLEASDDLIGKNTLPNPNTHYGKSKWEAEKLISTLSDENFKICVLRPPMVYGENAPGNLAKLIRIVKKVHFFPTLRNQRSSITVDLLSDNIRKYIDSKSCGIKFPQNDTYMCTVDIVQEKMREENIKVIYISIFNPIIKLLIGKVKIITKCFGNLMYEK